MLWRVGKERGSGVGPLFTVGDSDEKNENGSMPSLLRRKLPRGSSRRRSVRGGSPGEGGEGGEGRTTTGGKHSTRIQRRSSGSSGSSGNTTIERTSSMDYLTSRLRFRNRDRGMTSNF